MNYRLKSNDELRSFSEVDGLAGRHARIRRAHLLDAARIDAALDLEEALQAPLRVPAVRHEPVVRALLGAPTHELHSVATLRDELEAALLVDPALVGHEALVDHESHLHGPIGHELLLDVGHTVDGVGAGRLHLRAAPGLPIRALLRAAGR